MKATTSLVTPADRDAIYAWWTDYAEHDHRHRAFARYGDVARRVVWREPAKGVEYVDEGRIIGIPVTLRTTATLAPPERVHARTDSRWGVLETDYWFEALGGGGTRITARAQWQEHPAVRFAAPLTQTVLHGALAYDLRTHVKEFEAERGIE